MGLLLNLVEFDEQLELGHFTLSERKCRVCGKMKDLIDGYYLIRKNKNIKSSARITCSVPPYAKYDEATIQYS